MAVKYLDDETTNQEMAMRYGLASAHLLNEAYQKHSFVPLHIVRNMELACFYHFGIFEADDMIAFAQLKMIAGEGDLYHLVVDPSRQGEGIGQNLLVEMMRHPILRDMRTCFLEVRVSNEIARHIYEKLGFKAFGSRERYYSNGEDALIYRWERDEISRY